MGSHQPHPSAVAALWAQPIFSPAPMPAQPLAWAAEMGKLRSNIRQRSACFALAAHPVLDWFWQRHRLPATGFVKALLASSAFAQALPDLAAGLHSPCHDHWQGLPGRDLPAQLARALLWGGAYDHFAGTQAQALRIGQQTCAQLGLPLDGEGVQAWRNHSAWSHWFDDVAWDSTFLIAHHRQRRAWLLAVTDTD